MRRLEEGASLSKLKKEPDGFLSGHDAELQAWDTAVNAEVPAQPTSTPTSKN